MKKLSIYILLLFYCVNLGAKSCQLPENINKMVVNKGIESLKENSDVNRNYNHLKKLCLYALKFKENKFKWRMLLVLNPKREHGLFWFLPHDNENSAFDSAVYAVQKYGGGFLSILNSNKRYNLGQDPNRNFSNSNFKICKEQSAPSPIYTKKIFSIIDYYKKPDYPYLALHNNTNKGGVSILKENQKTKSYFAYPKSQINSQNQLTDEDNLVYMVGLNKMPPSIIYRLLEYGLNVKYEVVNKFNNDCSMSNYIVLEKGTNSYFNIEAEHKKSAIQKVMIDRLIQAIFN